MSVLSSITKRLQYSPARLPTRAEAEAAQSQTGSLHPDKYLTILGSREINRIPVDLVIPAHKFSYDFDINTPPERLLFQYTITMPSRFYFTKPIIVQTNRGPWYGILTVRFR